MAGAFILGGAGFWGGIRYRGGWAFGFAPYARVSFFSRRNAAPQKRNQKGLPLPWPCAALRVPSFRRRSRGPAQRAFHGDSIRPAINGAGRSQTRSKADQEPLSPGPSPASGRGVTKTLDLTRSAPSPACGRGLGRGAFDLDLPAPFIAGRVESLCRGSSGRSRERRGAMDGPARRPLERRWSEGTWSAAQGQGRGKRFWLLFGATAKK